MSALVTGLRLSLCSSNRGGPPSAENGAIRYIERSSVALCLHTQDMQSNRCYPAAPTERGDC